MTTSISLRQLVLLSTLLVLKYAHGWNTPSYTSPANGSTTSTTVVLDWGVVVNSEAYQCQLDTSASFDSPLFQEVTNLYANSSDGNFDTRTNFSGLRFGTIYRWRIRAYVPDDTSAWSIPRTFTTTDLVTLSSPAQGAILFTANRLNWQPSNGVTFYDAQLDTSATFDSPLFRTVSHAYANTADGNSDTQWDNDQLLFGTVYHWRVRARHNTDTSAWNGRSFITSDLVTLESPNNNANLFVAPRLNWSPHNGVAFYDAQVDTTLAFNSPLLQEVSHPYANTADGNSDTEWTVQPLHFGTTHYWRVRVRNTVDTSAWNGRSFNTLDRVNLTWPANLAVNMPIGGITLDWAPFSGITFYQLQLDTTVEFNSPQFHEAFNAYANSFDGNFDTRHTTPTLLADQVYFWRVRALHATDTSAWTMRIFSTGSAIQMPAVPQLVAPTNNSTVNGPQPNLVWNNAANATTYDIQYGNNADLTGATLVNTSSLQITTAPLTPGVDVFWRARARNASLISDWSPTWRFMFDPSTAIRSVEQVALRVFPNPNTGMFSVEGAAKDDVFRLYSMSGQMVLERKVNTSGTALFDVDSLPSGIYLLEVSRTDRSTILRVVRE